MTEWGGRAGVEGLGGEKNEELELRGEEERYQSPRGIENEREGKWRNEKNLKGGSARAARYWSRSRPSSPTGSQ